MVLIEFYMHFCNSQLTKFEQGPGGSLESVSYWGIIFQIALEQLAIILESFMPVDLGYYNIDDC